MKRKMFHADCIIYDCDGVLFDSLDQNTRLYNHIAVSLGRAPISDAEALYCHTHTLQESVQHIFQGDEKKFAEAMSFWKSDVKFEDFIGFLKMEPHVIEILGELKKRGMKTAISTNRTNTMAFIMDVFDLNQYFDMVVTALPKDVKNPKPHPESVQKILMALGVAKERALYIGDSEVDRKTARSSGVVFAAYKNHELEADYFIDDHLDLLSVLSDV
ncbi:MAG TPA: HAD-IA family hydrolase [Syntrophorhabdaceae bacterium]|nr:HAD-IA family hydrolase [Syntrophorhabdaceae bacterium]